MGQEYGYLMSKALHSEIYMYTMATKQNDFL